MVNERQSADSSGSSRRDTDSRPPVLVLGVGNSLLADEGVGVHVIRALEAQGCPPGVEFLDIGTGALDIIDFLADREKVIIIDAVKGDGEPGTIYRFTPDDMMIPSQTLMSVHQLDIPGILNIANLTNCAPQQVVIFGIEPKRIDWSLELSPEVAAVVTRVIELVLIELGGEHARMEFN